jgi:peptidase E
MNHITKFILHGGNTSQKSKDNDDFFAEILKDLESPVKVLIIYFSRKKSEWNKLFKDDSDNFKRVIGGKKIHLVLATKNINEFRKQIQDCDALYMRGGETKWLMSQLSKVDDFSEIIKGKVVAGSSAGAYVLSKYYMNSKGEMGKGLGILSIKTIAHYNKSKKHELEKLKTYGKNLKIFAIEEMKNCVIEK